MHRMHCRWQPRWSLPSLWSLLPLLPLLSALLLPATPAWAIYKCSDAGVIRYTDIACHGGEILDIKLPTVDTAAAQKNAEQDRATLKQLEAERKIEDRKNAQAQRQTERLRSVEQKKNKQCALLAQRKKWAEEDLRQADGKTQDKARRQSRRAAELYQRECGG